jgi:hypothetical protein
MILGFLEYHCDMNLIGLLNLSLKITTSMLVFAQVKDLPNHGLKAVLRKACAIFNIVSRYATNRETN